MAMSVQTNPNNPRSVFYWADYKNDKGLQLCSYAAQGFWMRLLCIAAECDTYGHLAVNGRALTLDDLSVMTGHSTAENELLLQELERNGVFSRTRTGVIYSRRMNRDAKILAEAKKNGKSGGNPSLSKTKKKIEGDNPPVKAGHNPHTLTRTQLKINNKNDEEEARGNVWFKRCKSFFTNGNWLTTWGPPPDKDGCEAPKEIIQQARKG